MLVCFTPAAVIAHWHHAWANGITSVRAYRPVLWVAHAVSSVPRVIHLARLSPLGTVCWACCEEWLHLQVALLSLVFTVTIILGNASLKYIPVSFNQAIGATTPLFTALLGFLIYCFYIKK